MAAPGQKPDQPDKPGQEAARSPLPPAARSPVPPAVRPPRPRAAQPPAEPPPQQPQAPPVAQPAPAPPPEANQPIMRLVEPVIPRNADDVVHNVVVRQLLDDQNAPNAVATFVRSPVLDTMRRITNAARDGTTMAPLKPVIERFTQANTELAQVVGTMFVRYQTERLVSWLEDQDELERLLRRCMRRGDLTPAEALVFLNMAKSEIKAVAEVLSEALKHGIPEPDAEVVSTKLDYTLQVTERQTMQGFDKTTPQGREIVRKLVMRARKKLNGTKRVARG